MRTFSFLLFVFIGCFSMGQDSSMIRRSFSLPAVQRPICVYPRGQESVDRYLDEANTSTYDSIAQLINANKSLRFELRSHTDGRGADSLNVMLSQNRANEWVKNLIARGVDSSQIQAVGYGSSMPISAWIGDSTYSIERPMKSNAKLILLTKDYINTFRASDKEKFERLHMLNRREELVVISKR